jgi:hypothetical protein
MPLLVYILPLTFQERPVAADPERGSGSRNPDPQLEKMLDPDLL